MPLNHHSPRDPMTLLSADQAAYAAVKRRVLETGMRGDVSRLFEEFEAMAAAGLARRFGLSGFALRLIALMDMVEEEDFDLAESLAEELLKSIRMKRLELAAGPDGVVPCARDQMSDGPALERHSDGRSVEIGSEFRVPGSEL